MSQSVVPFRPPLLRAVDEIGLLLDDVADLDPVYLTTGQKQELLLAVERQRNRMAALQAKALAAAATWPRPTAPGTRAPGLPTRPGRTRRLVGRRSGSPKGSTNAGRSWPGPTPPGPSRPHRPG